MSKGVVLDSDYRSLMRRADLVLAALVPKQMPVLLDALTAHAAQSLKVVQPRYLLNEDWRAFARGDVDEPSERLRNTADRLGTTPDEMAERWREHNAEEGTDFHSTRAIYFGQVLASSSVQSRHAIYCTEEMTALVRSAATRQVAESALSQADLPSPAGVAFLYDRSGPLLLRWASTSEGMVSANLAEIEGLKRLLADEFADPDMHVPQPFEQARLSAPLSDEPPGKVEVFKPFGAEGQYSAIRPDNAIHTLFALSHLSRQAKLAKAEIQTVRSPARDRRGRRRTRTDSITYLIYHTAAHQVQRDDDDRGRTYSHRWVVRGHWRRQWYPSQNRHIPIWITEYIAGPQDMPIEYRDKVLIARPPTADEDEQESG
ncbi:hypothetical protein [Mycolicibacterium obuense]|uniref:Uncharacterized protein n=1 Tax=Mycolicibacterium obuense TaxID=1807 RepID=A0A0M2K4F7_9MYCO|nr:hypothetical protein [Mycolicibacterium obuense]KKF03805.1 hypothetical protein WN67_00755 [Mycolicibacterium obuense]